MTKLTILPQWNRTAVSQFRAFMQSDPDQVYGLDVETTAITDQSMFDRNARMRLIQFGSVREGWVLDPDPHTSDWCQEIERALNDSDTRFVSHTNYDELWCRKVFGIRLDQRIIDTHTMSCLLEPGPFNDHSLKGLCDRFLDDQLSKAEVALHARFKELAPVGHRVGKKAGSKLMVWGFNNIPLDDPFYTRYAGLDAVYVRRLLRRLAARFRTDEFAELSVREQKVWRISNDMQWRGMRVDKPRTVAVLGELETEYNQADSRLAETFGFSPRSPKRAHWLVNQGVQFTEYTKTGNPSVNKTVLPGLITRYEQFTAEPEKDPWSGDYEQNVFVLEVLRDLLALSQRQNVMNNLRAALRSCDDNGFIHPNINVCQAITGRMSVTGVAMQTFKKDDKRLRGCYIARDGYVFVGADYHSQEIRLALAFSGEPAYARIIAEGLNQHDLTAEMIFGNNWKDIFKARDRSKVLNFMQQYGGGPKKIAAQLGISYEEAYILWAKWRKAYKTLVRWTDNMSVHKVVVNPWGRRIPSDRMRPYANGNYMIQSSGRDVLGDALIELQAQGWDEYLWMLIHDEVILEVPIELASNAVIALERCMRAQVGSVELPVTASVIGQRWSGEPLHEAA